MNTVLEKAKCLNKTIVGVYADGSAGAQTLGGWGFVVVFSDKTVLEIGGFESQPTTNQRMELKACIEALRFLEGYDRQIELYTDSEFVQKGYSQCWVQKWQSNGWQTSEGQDVKNADLWVESESLRNPFVTICHLRGHTDASGKNGSDRRLENFEKYGEASAFHNKFNCHADKIAGWCRINQQSINRFSDGVWTPPSVSTTQKAVVKTHSAKTFSDLIQHEFVYGSAIAHTLYQKSVRIVSDTESLPGGEVAYPIHEALGWKLTRFGHEARKTLEAAFLENEDASVWQAKLSEPRVDEKGKTIKYETPKGNSSKAYLPSIPVEIREKISQRYKVEIPLEGSFWDWLEQHPEIPIILTEGGKKALCLLSLGYVAIALTGVNGGYRSKDAEGLPTQPYLIPDTARFCQPERKHVLAFDQDAKNETAQKVSCALAQFGRLLESSRGNVFVSSWDGSKGKGVDDLVVNAGIEAWENSYTNAVSFEGWSFAHRLTYEDYKILLNSDNGTELLWSLQHDWNNLDPEKRNALIQDVLRLAAAYLSKKQADDLLISLGFDPEEEQKELYKAAESVIKQCRDSNQLEALAGLKGGYLWSVITKNRYLFDYLRLIQEFGSRLRFNTLKKQVELDGKPFSVGDARMDLSIDFGFQPKTKADFPGILLKVAKRNSYSPIVEYLDQVSTEHGQDTAILERIAQRYFGRNEPIYNTMLVRTLIGAVARAYNPGCKLDTALILRGRQGAKKSTFFKALAGGKEYFDDSLANVNDKDEKLKLHRVWFVEWAELETVFKRKDVSNTKAFLSSSVDYVRPPYGREIEEMLRPSIIVGSTNEDEFLSDSTGSRRFWVVPVLQDFDIELLQRERDRIWAAAVSLYRSSEQWWLTQSEEMEAASIAEQFQTSDPWDEVVIKYAQNFEFVTVKEILDHAIKLDIGKQDKACQMRVSNILKQAGWKKDSKRIDGNLSKVWVKSASTPPTPEDESNGSQLQNLQAEPTETTDSDSYEVFEPDSHVEGKQRDPGIPSWVTRKAIAIHRPSGKRFEVCNVRKTRKSGIYKLVSHLGEKYLLSECIPESERVAG